MRRPVGNSDRLLDAVPSTSSAEDQKEPTAVKIRTPCTEVRQKITHSTSLHSKDVTVSGTTSKESEHDTVSVTVPGLESDSAGHSSPRGSTFVGSEYSVKIVDLAQPEPPSFQTVDLGGAIVPVPELAIVDVHRVTKDKGKLQEDGTQTQRLELKQDLWGGLTLWVLFLTSINYNDIYYLEC